MLKIMRGSIIRPFIPVVVGICLGITLNMMVAPFFDEFCDPSTAGNPDKVIELSEKSNNVHINKESLNHVEVIDKPMPIPTVKKEDLGKKFIRPRFASTELGIREKLFVGVLTSANTINSFAVAVNKTLSHYVTKTMFFTNTRSGPIPSGMSVYGAPDQQNSLLPLHALKYIKDHFASTFDYYMLITDRTYIRAEKVYEFVSHISVSQDVYLGALEENEDNQQFCTVEGGIILSQV